MTVAMAWPARGLRRRWLRTISGWPAATSPRTKNVARMPASANIPRTRCGAGLDARRPAVAIPPADDRGQRPGVVIVLDVYRHRMHGGMTRGINGGMNWSMHQVMDWHWSAGTGVSREACHGRPFPSRPRCSNAVVVWMTSIRTVSISSTLARSIATSSAACPFVADSGQPSP